MMSWTNDGERCAMGGSAYEPALDRCGIEVGQVWQRKPPGRERLRIERVWQGYVYEEPELWTIRAQPMNGGKVVIAAPEWIHDHYKLSGDKRSLGGEATGKLRQDG